MGIERFPVEAGHILLFARAIGDTNPAYYGALSGDDVVPAPPTFVQSSAQFDPDYFLRPKPGEPWFGSGKQRRPARCRRAAAAAAVAAAGLHAEQHYEYHRPLRAGEVLTGTDVPGKTWEKEGRRGGKLVFSENVTEYREPERRARRHRPRRGRAHREGRGAGELTMADVKVGDKKELRRWSTTSPARRSCSTPARPATTTRCTPTRSSPPRSPATRRCSPTACSPWA